MGKQTINLSDSHFFLIRRYRGGSRDRKGSWEDGKERERKKKGLGGSTSSDSRKGVQMISVHGLIFDLSHLCKKQI